MDGITLINTPSSGAEASRLLTVRVIKVGTSRIHIPFVNTLFTVVVGVWHFMLFVILCLLLIRHTV